MRRSERWPLVLAAADGLMAVLSGAFGAHAAGAASARELLRTGAEYQMVHAAAALAAMALGLPRARLAAWLFALGGLVFAGSLDLLAATGARLLGAVTPLGGLMMICGWGALIVSLLAPPRP
jgi:uncharacterized membrane protein YgdD (TMEM256/DUF423 family)